MNSLENAYPYNMNTMPNPVDTRSEPLLRSGGGRGSSRGSRCSRGSSRGKGGKKLKNYTGRQIGCRSRSSRTRTRSRSSRMQSGGDLINNLPMDASMIVQSATKVGGDLWNDLKGTPSMNPSPFPFLDQGIKEPSTPTTTHSQSGGLLRHRRRRPRHRKSQRSKKYKKTASNSKRCSSSRRQFRHRLPQQSGGDIFSYLPFDMSTTIRSAANSVGNAISGAKGLPGSVSPLPYNDHALQKPELKASDHLPDLQKYYRNANLSIPSL